MFTCKNIGDTIPLHWLHYTLNPLKKRKNKPNKRICEIYLVNEQNFTFHMKEVKLLTTF